FYLKNEALSKLSGELKSIMNDETYLKWLFWGKLSFLSDKGKAAKMYKTVADALKNGNNELLTRDLTMLEMVMEEYSTAKKEYDTLAEAFEEKYYDGGKINDGLSAEKAGEILDEVLGKETATYGTMIPETEADIAKYTDRVQIVMRPQEPAPEEQNDGTEENTPDQSGDTDGETEPKTGTEGDDPSEPTTGTDGAGEPTDGNGEPTDGSGTTGTEENTPKALIYSSVVEAFEAILSQKEAELQNAKTEYLNAQSEKVNDSFKNGREYLEEALKNYESVDLEAVKKEAESLWKATPDTQNFFEEWFNYYGSLLNFKDLAEESALLGSAKVIHSIQNYLNAFNEILSEKNRAEYESYREELDKSRKVYANELSSLYQQTLEIERAGLIEWNKAYNKLQDKFTDFQNEFINRWNTTTEKWQEAIEGFEADKAQWINAMFMEAESRSLAGLESAGTSASVSLKTARDKVSALDSFDYSGLEQSSLVGSVLSDSKISAIESLLNNKASSIEQAKSPAFMLKASDEYQLYQAAQSVTKIFEETNKRAEEISARASAQRFKIEIDQKIKDSIKKIDDKNAEMRSSFDERAFGEGYTVKNGYYRKKIVKDVSVFSVDTENIKVRMWKDFEASDPEVNLSLLEENVDAVSFSVIMTLVSAQLTDWENSIFGVSGVVSTGDDKASTKTVSYIVGEFEKYAYGEQYKDEVELGKGLVGAILLDFENNSQKEKAGWEALDAPTWERKLWCSDTFPGPSIREFSTMVASIVATVCTFGAGAVLAVAVSAAIMATNELTFELADVGVGYHDWDEAAKNVAKAAVSGAITGASGAAMGAASKVGGIGGVFLKTGITSSSSITTQFTNAFIDGGFSGVKDAFNSWSDWQGIAVTTGSAFISNSMSYAILGDQNINFASYNPDQIKDVVTAVNLGSGLLGNALEYAVTGETFFNLLNLSMFGLEYGSMWGAGGMQTLSGGLLEFHLGNSGIQFAVGSGGTDISIGTVVSALNGVSVIQKDNEINTYIQQHYGGDELTAQMLKSLYAQEEYGAQDTLEEILSGNLSKEEVAQKYFEVQLQVLNAILGVLTIDEEADSEEKSVLEKIEEREEEIVEEGSSDTGQEAEENSAGDKTETESDNVIEEKSETDEKPPEPAEEKKDVPENAVIVEEEKTTTAAPEQKAEATESAETEETTKAYINQKLVEVKKALEEIKQLFEKYDLWNIIQERFKDVKGKPYANTVKEEKYDERGVITKDSPAFNCIGLLTYLYDIAAAHDCKNFDEYTMFNELTGITDVSQLKPGDVIWWQYDETDKDGSTTTSYHVQVWTGNGSTYESCGGKGVREKNYQQYLGWLYGSQYNHSNQIIKYYRYTGAKR
ncbi:MAG: hypothetical protein IJL70_07210, partial [Treponema sp.]|nr:hypothetical protein [Treponema sp.]